MWNMKSVTIPYYSYGNSTISTNFKGHFKVCPYDDDGRRKTNIKVWEMVTVFWADEPNIEIYNLCQKDNVQHLRMLIK